MYQPNVPLANSYNSFYRCLHPVAYITVIKLCLTSTQPLVVYYPVFYTTCFDLSWSYAFTHFFLPHAATSMCIYSLPCNTLHVVPFYAP
jgi:hypothetical protein